MNGGTEIIKPDPALYRLFFGGGLSAIVDYHAGTGANSILAALQDGVPCGALFYHQRGDIACSSMRNFGAGTSAAPCRIMPWRRTGPKER